LTKVERRGIIAERSQGAGQNRRKTGKKELKSSKKPGEEKSSDRRRKRQQSGAEKFLKKLLDKLICLC
jgi:hypothetical protein